MDNAMIDRDDFDSGFDDWDWEIIERGRANDVPELQDTCFLDALWYRVERGWSVVPQRPGEKRPTVGWKPYQSIPPRPSQLYDWYRQWPDAGVALVLGPVSGAFAIDCDGEEGHRALLGHLGSVPEAATSISGSGKPYRYHLLFQHPGPDVPTQARYCPWSEKLEFRGEGGMIVIPPSLHPSGRCYAWEDGKAPWERELPPLPSQILEALRRRTQSRAATPSPGAPARITPIRIGGLCGATRRFLSGEFAFDPGWNCRLFRAACDMAGNSVPEANATEMLLRGAQPRTEQDRQQALRTIQSAYAEDRYPANQVTPAPAPDEPSGIANRRKNKGWSFTSKVNPWPRKSRNQSP